MRIVCGIVCGILFALGAGCNDDDPVTDNCGRMTDKNWTAPETCSCTGPNGETTFVPEGSDDTVDITCDDRRLQPCPSTSGIGCELPFKAQHLVDPTEPALVNMHVDVGGHMHDICCNQHYSQEEGIGFRLRCNGCGGKAPPEEIEVCENETFGGGVLDKPENAQFPCGAEWGYAARAFSGADVFWWTDVDTSIRWTPKQVVERNLASTPPPYSRPDSDERPLFGQALAPNATRSLDQRAPAGQLVGTTLLSDPYDATTGGLGMNASQISSFCQSESATRSNDGWTCD